MVDFQSRDSSRGYGNNSDDADDTDDEAEGAADESTPEEAETDPESPVSPPETASEEASEFGPETLPFAVVTVENGQSVEEDATGSAVVDAIEHAGEGVSTRELISPSYDGVQTTIGALARRGDVEAIVTLGGTGVSPDDVTVDAAEPLFDKRLPGFGELYRVLSHDFDGTAVVRTRATAGIVDGVPVFCLPGDTGGARRGVEQIVLEEAERIAEEAETEE
jgi:molybdenum cofactor biosynthesis protein B